MGFVTLDYELVGHGQKVFRSLFCKDDHGKEAQQCDD